MNSKVEIISKEIIKPSSQTPHHLNIFHLSCFDQFAPPIYVPIIFFYEARGLITSNHAQISQNLKKSLSETLTSFYPLAGRVRENGSVVECNDAGAEFVEARVRSQLTELLQEPNVERLNKLLPLDPATTGHDPSERGLLLVQANFFDCGGIAIGVCAWHQIVDTPSMMKFLTTWAAAANVGGGQGETRQLGFQLSSYFPAQEISGSSSWKTLMPDENLGTKMLVFTKEKLAVLRQAAISSSVEIPTRVEVVSAFIWQHLSKFLRRNPKKGGSFAAFLEVNMRARVGQNNPMLENVFGNFTIPAFVFPESDGADEEFHESVIKFRSAIRSIDGNIPIDRESQDRMIHDVLNLFSKKEIEWYHVTSWCRFPIYEVDFVWGRPVWVSTSRGGMKNGIVLVDNKDGEGVEVWLMNMDQDFLEILETQLKLIRSIYEEERSI